MHRALRWTIKVVVGRRPVIDFMRSNERTTHPHLHIPQHTERERESDWERERTAPHSMESIHRTNPQRVEKWKMQIMARFCHPVMPSRSQTGRVCQPRRTMSQRYYILLLFCIIFVSLNLFRHKGKVSKAIGIWMSGMARRRRRDRTIQGNHNQ